MCRLNIAGLLGQRRRDIGLCADNLIYLIGYRSISLVELVDLRLQKQYQIHLQKWEDCNKKGIQVWPYVTVHCYLPKSDTAAIPNASRQSNTRVP
jgi:hypothetical protein